MKKSVYILGTVLSALAISLTLTACGECNHSYSNSYEKDANNHWHVCEKGCGQINGKEAHDFGDVNVTKEPTCKEEGSGTRACKECGYTVTVSINKTANHAYGSTYESDATSHWTTCSVCGDKNTAQHAYTGVGYDKDNHYGLCVCGVKDASEAHTWGEGTVNQDGSTTYVCTKEGCEASKTAPATPPSEEHQHSYTETITKEPSCTEAGVKTFTCSCNDSYTESIPMEKHEYTYGDYIKDETYHWKSCECGAMPEVKDKHVFSDPVTQGSYKVYKCIHCDHTKREMIKVDDAGGYIDPDGWT